jgi:hypothetical protein
MLIVFGFFFFEFVSNYIEIDINICQGLSEFILMYLVKFTKELASCAIIYS